jgi:hypothetical protein
MKFSVRFPSNADFLNLSWSRARLFQNPAQKITIGKCQPVYLTMTIGDDRGLSADTHRKFSSRIASGISEKSVTRSEGAILRVLRKSRTLTDLSDSRINSRSEISPQNWMASQFLTCIYPLSEKHFLFFFQAQIKPTFSFSVENHIFQNSRSPTGKMPRPRVSEIDFVPSRF